MVSKKDSQNMQDVLRRIGTTEDGILLREILLERVLSSRIPLGGNTGSVAVWASGRNEAFAEIIKNLK